ncbi:MAG: DUF6498-containing protein [Chitinophagales bacterium]|nr:DUF6498-containing protein [Chitinophagales bacterium]
MTQQQNRLIHIITFLSFTILGIYKKEVTIFYIFYLFWMEALIRQVIELAYIIKRDKNWINSILASWQAFFVMFIYGVFILVLFGLIPIIKDKNLETVVINATTFSFKNIYFNLSIFAFAVQYIFYIINNGYQEKTLVAFSRRHIILHISIILGGMIQVTGIADYINSKEISNIIIIIPFMLLKIFLDRGFRSENDDIAVKKNY